MPEEEARVPKRTVKQSILKKVSEFFVKIGKWILWVFNESGANKVICEFLIKRLQITLEKINTKE